MTKRWGALLRRWTALGGLCACSLVTSTRAQASDTSTTTVVDRAFAILSAEATSAERQGRELLAVGQGIDLLLLTVLRDGRIERAEQETLVLGDVQTESVLFVFQELGRSKLQPLLNGIDLPSADEPTRVAFLRILERVGDARDVEALLVAVEVQDTVSPSAALVSTFERALTILLERDRSGLVQLRDRLLELPPGVTTAIVRAVGAQALPDALSWLVQHLATADDLDGVLLSQIGRVAGGLPPQLDEALLGPVRGYLDVDDVQLVRASALALGTLGDARSLEKLVVLLRDDDRGLADTAAWSLTEITGLRRSSAEAWESWLAGERRWHAERATWLKRALSGRPDQVGSALDELGRHRYDRERTAESIAAVLEHSSPELRRSACATLRRLGSTIALERLIERLDDEEAVANEAWRTLRALTGQKLPLDVEAWAALGPALYGPAPPQD